jgi:hypothetical protein
MKIVRYRVINKIPISANTPFNQNQIEQEIKTEEFEGFPLDNGFIIRL